MGDLDPCSCAHTCGHGERCLGGHANYPDAHWYHCDVCTSKNVTYRLADERWLTVAQGCGHALGPFASQRDLAVAGVEHRRECATEVEGNQT